MSTRVKRNSRSVCPTGPTGQTGPTRYSSPSKEEKEYEEKCAIAAEAQFKTIVLTLFFICLAFIVPTFLTHTFPERFFTRKELNNHQSCLIYHQVYLTTCHFENVTIEKYSQNEFTTLRLKTMPTETIVVVYPKSDPEHREVASQREIFFIKYHSINSTTGIKCHYDGKQILFDHHCPEPFNAKHYWISGAIIGVLGRIVAWQILGF